ncbi:cold-shock protein [Acinetobacter radioresistens]|uniref:cold-shock protein n=1 Tax=Acinetobacter radioresistens TaxID=40216 RepID=UPI00374D6916
MMRDQGRLVEWFDEKGYGFIQPNEPDKGRVFLHIKDFARPGPRPINWLCTGIPGYSRCTGPLSCSAGNLSHSCTGP